MIVVHLADVHWRGLARHEEYKRAFTRMFDDLKQNVKPDAIVVCGDIVHSKTQGISPELIDYLTWWFNAMAAICDVYVILGNHDGNLMNKQRQDAISPIITALANPRIKLFKRSGVYKLANGFNFCVFSLFDEDGWKNVAPVKGDVNIALFHGSVAGSVTDAGWALESDLDVSFFKPYDFCFLGDIHAMQFLSERAGKPWIAYPGSTIMQDYGERPGKGYLVWNIKDRDDFSVHFRHVEHDSEFRTIEWTNLKDTLALAKTLPRGSRIRVRSNTMIPHVEMRQVMTELTTFHGASEVVFKDDYSVSSNPIVESHDKIEKQDIRNVDVLFKLFKQYLGDSALSSDQWTFVKQLIEKYIAIAVQDDSGARNVRWQLKDFWFDNLFGYGSNNYINFKKLSGITGVFGPNRVGKSSVIGSLMYTLFNGSDRGAIKNLHIINTRKGHCRAKLAFSLNGNDYCVERQSVRYEAKDGAQHAVTSLNLSQVASDGTTLVDLNGEQRKDTEKILRALIGTAEDIMLTGVATQGDMNKFIDAGSAHRDLVISRFLDLIIFEKMSQLAKDDSSLIKSEVNGSPERNWDSLIASKEDELQRKLSEILRLETLLKEKRAALDVMRVQLATEFMGDIVTHADVENVRNRLDESRNDLDASRIKLKVASTSVLSLEDDIAKLKAAIAVIPVDKLKNELKTIAALKDSANVLRQTFEKEKQILVGQDRSVKRLLEVPCGDQFPSCKYIRDSHLDKQKIVIQRDAVDRLQEQINAADRAISDLDVGSIERQLTENEKLLRQEASLDLKLFKARQAVTDLKRHVTNVEGDVQKNELQLADYISRVVEDDGSEQLKQQIHSAEKLVDDLDAKRIKLASQRGTLTAEITRLKQEKERYHKIKSEWFVYEMFIQATSKRGIPAQIIQKELPIINAEIARILQGVVDYTLRLEKDDDSNSTEVYIDYGDSKRLIELGSGMEKMISSLAIRVALQNATSLPRPDFLIIDEGFGTLDETNIEACNRLLVSLKRWFRNIVVISHIDGVKDITDNVIEIGRNGKDSYVRLE